MKAVRIIATILFYLSLVGSAFYLLTAAYATFVILLSGANQPSWLPFHSLDDSTFQIYFPFTKIPFLQGDNNFSYKLIMMLVTCGYGLFLWLLSRVFNAFMQNKLFVKKGVTQLTRFYVVNLFVPILILILFCIIGIGISEIVMITLLHGVIGIFAFFMAAIFKQGLVLQEEQDLTL